MARQEGAIMHSLLHRAGLRVPASVVSISIVCASYFIGDTVLSRAAAQTPPAASKRTKIEVILADKRICWIREVQDLNGNWGEDITSDPKPRSLSDIRDGLDIGTSANPELSKVGNDLYLRPKPGDRDQDNRNLRYRKVPCPDVVANPDGIYLGLELIKTLSKEQKTETVAATGAFSSQYTDSNDPLGVGFVVGKDFTIARSNWIIGPYASFDWLQMSVNHTFANGAYFGSTTHWVINAGARVGYRVTPDWLIYGLGGAAWLNEDLNFSFPLGVSQKNTTTPGALAGFGTEYHPPAWQVAGNPISLSAQYQHVWYDTATFNMPVPASPAFNYAFKRDDDTVKFGVIVRFR
jgi:opacity protein-like surface antigen